MSSTSGNSVLAALENSLETHRVSVVIPCHNYGRFLEDCVSSVLVQSRPPDEIVIVDDGSSDDSLALATRLAQGDPRIRVLSRTPARGAANTFNTGVHASTGNCIVVLSADDLLPPTYIERSLRALGVDGDVAISGIELFGGFSETKRPGAFSLPDLMLANPYHGSMLMRRSVFELAGGYPEGIHREDWLFWLHAVARGARGVVVHDSELLYRQHGPSRNAISRFAGHRDRVLMWRMLQEEHGAVRVASLVFRGAVRRVLRRFR